MLSKSLQKAIKLSKEKSPQQNKKATKTPRFFSKQISSKYKSEANAMKLQHFEFPKSTYKSIREYKETEKNDAVKKIEEDAPFDADLSDIPKVSEYSEKEMKTIAKRKDTIQRQFLKKPADIEKILNNFTILMDGQNLQKNQVEKTKKQIICESAKEEQISDSLSFSEETSSEVSKDYKSNFIERQINSSEAVEKTFYYQQEDKSTVETGTAKINNVSNKMKDFKIIIPHFQEKKLDSKNQQYQSRYPKRFRRKPRQFWKNERIQYKENKAVKQLSWMHFYRALGGSCTEDKKLRVIKNIKVRTIEARLTLKPSETFESQGIQYPYERLVIQFEQVNQKVFCQDDQERNRIKKNDTFFVNSLTSFKIENNGKTKITFTMILYES